MGGQLFQSHQYFSPQPQPLKVSGWHQVKHFFSHEQSKNQSLQPPQQPELQLPQEEQPELPQEEQPPLLLQPQSLPQELQPCEHELHPPLQLLQLSQPPH